MNARKVVKINRKQRQKTASEYKRIYENLEQEKQDAIKLREIAHRLDVSKMPKKLCIPKEYIIDE